MSKLLALITLLALGALVVIAATNLPPILVQTIAGGAMFYAFVRIYTVIVERMGA